MICKTLFRVLHVAPPSPPNAPTCPDRTGTSLLMNWNIPSSVGCRLDTFYIVEHQPVTSTGSYIVSNRIDSTTFTISELEPITNYRIRVYSENGVSDLDLRPGIRSTRMVETVCTTGEGGMYCISYWVSLPVTCVTSCQCVSLPVIVL